MAVDRRLHDVIEEKRYRAFTVPQNHAQVEALGLVVAEFCDWSSDVLTVAITALEDANFHAWAEMLEAIKDMSPADIRGHIATIEAGS